MSEVKAMPTCGIIMPISEIDGCSARHWVEVRNILEGAIIDAGMKPRLVSDAPEAGIIQTRIIGNILNDEMVVCDVSCRNPNVMFELGLRIAFDKPVVIVKDDVTLYSFDTMPVEHVSYPRDLRFGQIVDFKAALSEKLKATADVSPHKTYLQSLGPIRVAAPDMVQVGEAELILDEIRALQRTVGQLREASIKGGAPRRGDYHNIKKEIFVSTDSGPVNVSVVAGTALVSDDVVYFEKLAEDLDVEFEYDPKSSCSTIVGPPAAVDRVAAEVKRRGRKSSPEKKTKARQTV